MLLPKATGLRFCLSHLNQDLDAIYDMTIGYSNVKADDEPYYVVDINKSFVEGRPPKQVHIHVNRIPIKLANDILEEDIKFEETASRENPLDRPCEPHKTPFGGFLYRQFMQKDHLMEKFFTDGKFTQDHDEFRIPLGKKWLLPNSNNRVEYALIQLWVYCLLGIFSAWYLFSFVFRP